MPDTSTRTPQQSSSHHRPGRMPAACRDIACNIILYGVLLFACLLPATGCGSRPFRASSLFKTTIDLVAEDHRRAMQSLLEDLMLKLYRRNPSELAKAPGQTIATRRSLLFDDGAQTAFAELGGRQGTDALLLCFDERFSGDRVFALMAGLCGMIRVAYNGKTHFYLFDRLDPQRLYNSARNIEILVWRLNHRLDRHGAVFLLTNETGDEEQNLSFERLFGKMIAVQDLLASIIADRTNRTIVAVVHRLASAAFLPVGL